jgi:hypothetical protein
VRGRSCLGGGVGPRGGGPLPAEPPAAQWRGWPQGAAQPSTYLLSLFVHGPPHPSLPPNNRPRPPAPAPHPLQVCGNPNLDFAALERNAKYEGGFSAASQAVQWLWAIVREDFGIDEKKMFLKFFTGSDRCVFLGVWGVLGWGFGGGGESVSMGVSRSSRAAKARQLGFVLECSWEVSFGGAVTLGSTRRICS